MSQEEHEYITEIKARLDFLNFDEGVEHCLGDEEFYLDYLVSFVDSNDVEAYKKAYLENNWDAYRSMMHTLKGIASYIGAEELSIWAEQLENAVKEKDEDFVHHNHYSFIGYFEGLLRQIDSVLAANNEQYAGRLEKPQMLLVGLDKDSVHQMTEVFSDQFQLAAAADNEEMMAILEHGRRPDIILLDMTNPAYSLDTWLKPFKKHAASAQIPMVLIYSEKCMDNLLQGVSEGVSEYIVKPFHIELVMMRVARALQFARLQNDLHSEVSMRCKVYKEKNHRISILLSQVVDALGKTIDAKDKFTKGHSERVAKYSVMIGKKLGLSKDDLTALNYAALLHDIGKLKIPDKIINKPDKLTKEEYDIVKQHPVWGTDILRNFTAMKGVHEAARWHHERFDGAGYPDGKQGAEIPEAVRIISVADAYDSMTSNRAYRDIKEQSLVRSEIEKGRGTQFDPVMANIMLEIIDEDKNYDLREK